MCHSLIEIQQECCLENYSKCREKKNPSKNVVAARNANVSLSLGRTIDANDRKLLSKFGVSNENQEIVKVEDDDPFQKL